MSVDHVHPYDILAMNGASAALAVSDIPVAKHVGSVRVGKLDGDFVVNPAEERHEELELDLIVAGTDEAILMVEAGADGVTEQEILDALDIAHGEIKKLTAAFEELREKAGKEKLEIEEPKIDEGCLRRSRARTAELDRGDPDRGQARAPGRDRRRQGRGLEHTRPPAEEDEAEEANVRVKAAFANREGHDPQAHRRRQEAPRRTRHRRDPPDRDRGRPLPARPRCAVHPRRDAVLLANVALGTTRMDMKVDNLGLQEKKTFWHHSTSRRTRSGRPASCAARSAATSATARSPSGRCSPTIPDHEEFPT